MNSELYNKILSDCSNQLKNYSTSFSAGARMLPKNYQEAISGIYGFVRLASSVVDQLYSLKQPQLFDQFKTDTYEALETGESSNFVLKNFQKVIEQYEISTHLVDAFLFSMEMELNKTDYTSYEFNRYVYGSAEVLGLMCLKIFYNDDDEAYRRLMYPARKLGHAFKLVNLLRDLKTDYEERGRIFFEDVDLTNFTREDKRRIEKEIEASFYEGWYGIMHLKPEMRTGVYFSYLYYVRLLRKIRKTSPDRILKQTYKISKRQQVFLTIKTILDLNLGFAKRPDRLNLQVEIDQKSGFCGGVVKAIKKAEELLEEHGELYCVGEIVHNEEEVRRLEEKGLITIEKEEVAALHGKHVMFRAHGEPPKTYSDVTEKQNDLTDATCPIVLKIQKKMKASFEAGEQILLFGKRTHPETIGLNGQIKNSAIVIETLEELKKVNLPEKLTLFSQTTKDGDDYQNIIDYLKENEVDVIVNYTICKSVSNRRGKIQKFSREHDKILFVAGENSSNGKVLYKACKESNPQSFFIHSPNNIVRKWFNKGDKVGICGATSTPKWLMEEVQKIVEAY